MSTQLRLVETPEPRTPSKKATSRPASRRRARAVGRSARGGRRAVAWGEWRLDAQTRQVGQAGVARARRALAEVVEQELSQAS